MARELAKGGGEVEVGRQLYGEAAALAPLSFVQRGASSPEPTALLLLPALWGTAESMLPLIESVGRARRAIGVSFRGFGASARKVGPHTPLERAYELHALVGQLGLQSVVILGHQESSEVALEAAALLPGKVRALIFWSADTSGGNLSACRELANAIEQGTKRLDALLTDEEQMVSLIRPFPFVSPQWTAARALCAARMGGMELSQSAWTALRNSDPRALRETLRTALARQEARVSSSTRALHELPALVLRGTRETSTHASEVMAFRALCVAKGSKLIDLHGAGLQDVCVTLLWSYTDCRRSLTLVRAARSAGDCTRPPALQE
ncbi:MAG: hypothetical protein SGPRY_001344 [Prymnesium sp.]